MSPGPVRFYLFTLILSGVFLYYFSGSPDGSGYSKGLVLYLLSSGFSLLWWNDSFTKYDGWDVKIASTFLYLFTLAPIGLTLLKGGASALEWFYLGFGYFVGMVAFYVFCRPFLNSFSKWSAPQISTEPRKRMRLKKFICKGFPRRYQFGPTPSLKAALSGCDSAINRFSFPVRFTSIRSHYSTLDIRPSILVVQKI